jgi:hypothetical protein
MWKEMLAFLASLAAGPAAVDTECPKACAAVCVARASMERERPPEPGTEEPVPADPPLVPVPQQPTKGRIECRNGTCYWIDSKTGTRYRVIR